MKNKGLIGILGGSGFVGSELCGQLITAGYSVRLLTRNAEKCRHLKVLPALSIIQVMDYQSNTLSRELTDCHALINLIGILNEKGNDGKEFQDVHVGITRNALNACEKCRIPRLLQMSALNAHPDAPSHYLRSKGKAENYIKTFSDEHLDYTIFKPSVIFGEGDSFLNRFAGLVKSVPGVFPLACANSRFAPVYVGDVAKKFVAAIDDKTTFNQSFELCGPNIYTLKELVQYTAAICGYRRVVVSLPQYLSQLQATVFERLPGKPFSVDNFNSLKLDSVCSQGEPCSTSLQAIAPTYLGRS